MCGSCRADSTSFFLMGYCIEAAICVGLTGVLYYVWVYPALYHYNGFAINGQKRVSRQARGKPVIRSLTHGGLQSRSDDVCRYKEDDRDQAGNGSTGVINEHHP